MLHNSLSQADIHTLVNWVVGNLAARNALVLVAADKHKLLYQTDTAAYWILVNNVGPVWANLNPTQSVTPPFIIPIAASDEITALTVGSKVTFRMPVAMTLTSVRASLGIAQVSGVIFTINVKKDGVTIFSTKPTFDNTEKSTVTAVTLSVLSVTALPSDSEITIDIDQVGDATAKGLKVYLIGTSP